MKRLLVFLLVFIAFGLLFSLESQSWGFFAHKQINRLAVYTLPGDMIGFYKQHIEYISEHAVDPDKRRYAVDVEAARHYIDIDHYVAKGEDPFKVVPRRWDSAVAKFTEDTLQAYGIVPWHIEAMTRKLSWAFREKNTALILKYSADLGHYVGDAHVPLHTTKNYNGQLTGQKGIHGFWESRIPELFFSNYEFWTGRAKYLDSPLDAAWEAVQASFAAKDSVLEMEAMLNAEFSPDQKYSFEQRGQSLVQVYSVGYSTAYSKLMDGMIERRMKEAVIITGSLWYTAWVDAGQPNLNKLEQEFEEYQDTLTPLPEAERKKLNLHGHED